MTTCYRTHLQLSATLVLVTGLLPVTLAHGAEDKLFTQQPTIAPAQVRGAPRAAVPEAAFPKPKLFAEGPAPFWIWGADDNRGYYLRKEFTGGTTAARLRATCDNRMAVYLNGEEVARSDEWERPVELDVQKFIKPGANELLVEVENQGGPAGLLLKLALTGKDSTRFVVSDKTWQVGQGRRVERWVAAREVAKMGGGPWGGVFFEGAAGPAASSAFQVLPSFQVERLFTVPREQLGSWVCVTFDDKGRLIASDQDGKSLCRVTPPRIGSDEPTKVERLNVKITAAQGMLWAFGSLYLSVNGGPGSGLYRARDTDGDDQFDEVVKLKAFRGGGEHGPHGLRLSPDGKSILVVAGNHTLPPEKFDATRGVPAKWGEDILLPRQWDAGGHAVGILAPGGWIARTDPDGKTWELVSIGYRNAYDIAFNADGELFAYDSDMEWEMGMPWYRPTRVMHATGGSEFGWRSGSAKWPAYYPDSLPAMIDVGPGSPVGIEFGYGTKFPAKYQKALYILDWTFGTIYAVHLEPTRGTYRATKEEFLSRTPLPLTDAAVGPDGALYFAIGGRGLPSELFRVTYVGKEPTARVDYRDESDAERRALRRQLEQYHSPAADPAKAVEFVYPYLERQGRFLSYAARVALEHQPVQFWQERVLGETNPRVLIHGAIALAQQGEKAVQPRLLASLDRVDFSSLGEVEQLALLRAYALTFIRMGEPDKDAAVRLAKKFDALYPAASDTLNRELVTLLVYLKSPTVLPKTIALLQQPSKPLSAEAMQELLARNRGYGGPIAQMLANAPDLQKLHYALVLRNVRDGWTLEQRRAYFDFLNEARQRSGGASYQGHLTSIEKEAFDNATDADRLAIEAAGLRKPFKPKELPKPKGPGREWTLADLLATESRLKGRNFANGQRAYAASRCIVCHRFGGDGGATGPDLTQLAGRFTLKDLAEALVEPSKVISDQYKASTVTTRGGQFITGRIVSEVNGKLTIVTDPEDSTKVVVLKKEDIEETTPSPVSLMPADLLKPLGEDEVLDLLAYLLSRGDPRHAMFRK